MLADPGRTKLKGIDVIDVLSDLFILRGVPGHSRSDHGPEVVAKAVQAWITAVGTRGVRASVLRLARCARPTISAGQAPCGGNSPKQGYSRPTASTMARNGRGFCSRTTSDKSGGMTSGS